MTLPENQLWRIQDIPEALSLMGFQRPAVPKIVWYIYFNRASTAGCVQSLQFLSVSLVPWGILYHTMSQVLVLFGKFLSNRAGLKELSHFWLKRSWNLFDFKTVSWDGITCSDHVSIVSTVRKLLTYSSYGCHPEMQLCDAADGLHYPV